MKVEYIMSQNKKSELQTPEPNKALKCLDVFVGTWKTEGEIKATETAPAIPIAGTDTYKWLPGNWFMFHRVDVRMGDEQIYSTEIIGYDPSTGKYPMHYFGHQGRTGVMHAELEDNSWKFTGEEERFTGSFNKSGDIITGKWERLDDGDWVHWMDITLTKINNKT